MFRQPTQPPPKSSAANKSHCMCTCICQPCNLAGTLSSSLMRWIAFIWVRHLHFHRLSQREPTEPKHCCEYSIIQSASKSVSRPHEGSRCSGEKTETSFHRHPACHGFFLKKIFIINNHILELCSRYLIIGRENHADVLVLWPHLLLVSDIKCTFSLIIVILKIRFHA